MWATRGGRSHQGCADTLLLATRHTVARDEFATRRPPGSGERFSFIVGRYERCSITRSTCRIRLETYVTPQRTSIMYIRTRAPLGAVLAALALVSTVSAARARAAEIAVTTHPDPAIIEHTESQQLINCDFVLRNLSQNQL